MKEGGSSEAKGAEGRETGFGCRLGVSDWSEAMQIIEWRRRRRVSRPSRLFLSFFYYSFRHMES